MSQFSPPPPPPPATPRPLGGEMPVAYGPPPMSTAAVVGFVSSLLFCIPLVAPLVGLICGFVGIATTSGGQRRGRGLAIAALVISLAVGGLQAVGAYGGAKMLQAIFRSEPRFVRPLFRASGEKVDENVAKFYPHASARFRQQVSQEQLAEWVRAVLAKHGTLQEVRPTNQFIQQGAPGTVVVAQHAQFTGGSAPYTVILLFEGSWQPVVDDIRIDGDSPRSNASSAGP